ncbi:MAG: SIS domain-containing protein [Erysipelotrichaceae bacterium]|nr:SIS domain-containing protein [Erysipelotrichaceae bacterium]
MNKWMYDCIEEAPSACKRIMKNRESLLNELVELYLSKDYSKVLIVASGSSFNIANCAKYAMEDNLKKRVETVNSITFAKYDYAYHKDAFVLCLSQSGRSTNTIAAVETAKQMNYTTAVVSMIPNSPIARYCDNAYIYGSFDEGKDVFVARGLPTSTLFLILFSIEAGLKAGILSKEVYKTKIKELDSMIDLMINVRSSADKWYDLNKKDFYSMKRAMVCGIGVSYGVANEGALKIEETIGIPSNVYELEEFLHGPTYEVKKDNAIFLIDIDQRSHDRVLTIYKAMHELTDRVYLLTFSNEINGDKVLNINADPNSLFNPLLFVIPFQILASRVCDDLNIRAVTIYNHRSSQLLKTKTD